MNPAKTSEWNAKGNFTRSCPCCLLELGSVRIKKGEQHEILTRPITPHVRNMADLGLKATEGGNGGTHSAPALVPHVWGITESERQLLHNGQDGKGQSGWTVTLLFLRAACQLVRAGSRDSTGSSL